MDAYAAMLEQLSAIVNYLGSSEGHVASLLGLDYDQVMVIRQVIEDFKQQKASIRIGPSLNLRNHMVGEIQTTVDSRRVYMATSFNTDTWKLEGFGFDTKSDEAASNIGKIDFMVFDSPLFAVTDIPDYRINDKTVKWHPIGELDPVLGLQAFRVDVQWMFLNNTSTYIFIEVTDGTGGPMYIYGSVQ